MRMAENPPSHFPTLPLPHSSPDPASGGCGISGNQNGKNYSRERDRGEKSERGRGRRRNDGVEGRNQSQRRDSWGRGVEGGNDCNLESLPLSSTTSSSTSSPTSLFPLPRPPPPGPPQSLLHPPYQVVSPVTYQPPNQHPYHHPPPPNTSTHPAHAPTGNNPGHNMNQKSNQSESNTPSSFLQSSAASSSPLSFTSPPPHHQHQNQNHHQKGRHHKRHKTDGDSGRVTGQHSASSKGIETCGASSRGGGSSSNADIVAAAAAAAASAAAAARIASANSASGGADSSNAVGDLFFVPPFTQPQSSQPTHPHPHNLNPGSTPFPATLPRPPDFPSHLPHLPPLIVPPHQLSSKLPPQNQFLSALTALNTAAAAGGGTGPGSGNSADQGLNFTLSSPPPKQFLSLGESRGELSTNAQHQSTDRNTSALSTNTVNPFQPHLQHPLLYPFPPFFPTLHPQSTGGLPSSHHHVPSDTLDASGGNCANNDIFDSKDGGALQMPPPPPPPLPSSTSQSCFTVSSSIPPLSLPPKPHSSSPSTSAPSLSSSPPPNFQQSGKNTNASFASSSQVRKKSTTERGRERVSNDYNQHFVDTGERPQNFIRDVEEKKRFEEYPKLEKLMHLKKQMNQIRATPPQHIRASLREFSLPSLETKFDVILIDPPWSEYYDRCGGVCTSEDLTPWTLEEIASLRVDCIAENPSFCFIWCGVTHLEDARHLLNHWGFRRCEDICWVQTNKKRFSTADGKKKRDGRGGANVIHDESSILQRTTEHCLMGIKGTVRRSQDTHVIHANLDTDVLIDEEPEEFGSTEKPQEMYDLIERFCLGRRRIELFGGDRNIRAGWLTIGNDLSYTNFDSKRYNDWFSGDMAYPEAQDYHGGRYVGTTADIENLRPKSPQQRQSSSLTSSSATSSTPSIASSRQSGSMASSGTGGNVIGNGPSLID